jgi:hypothetical protein
MYISDKMIKQIAEELRGMAMRRDVVVISATQTKRSALEKDIIDMDDISESHGLVATVDAMMGITIPIDDAGNQEINKRQINLIASRRSYAEEEIYFQVDWNFYKMKSVPKNNINVGQSAMQDFQPRQSSLM